MYLSRTPEQRDRYIESMRREIRLPPCRVAKAGWHNPRFGICKPVNNIAKGTIGDVNILNVDETTITRTKPMKALGAPVKAGKWCTWLKRGSTYYVLPWEC